ncbi:hypothetical protein BH24ACT26_BH24ACT26_08080 [soil metagenome]
MPPCGTEGAPLRVPVIQTMTDYRHRDCFAVWCACANDLVSPPYVHLDDAKLAAWNHSFGWRVSDLRIRPEEANGTIPKRSIRTTEAGKTAPRRKPARFDPVACPYCEREMRPCNLPRHVAARHQEVGHR